MPIEFLEKKIMVVNDGFFSLTLRSLISYMLHMGNRSHFGDIMVIYSARIRGLPQNAVAVICRPPMMNEFTLPVFSIWAFSKRIF